jgi:hypothetical protein
MLSADRGVAFGQPVAAMQPSRLRKNEEFRTRSDIVE